MIKKVISFFTALSLTLMLFTGIPIGVSAADDIAINATNFPDEIFRNYIKENFDTDNNDSLSASEIANVKKIDIDGKNISDLTGIGYFTALTELIGKNNNLTSIDLSQNTELKTLNLYNNHLTSIDLSKNTKLNNFNITGNTYNVSSSVDGCTIEISSLSSILPTGFDLNNVRWIEGKLIDNDTKILCLGDPPVVSYTYKSGLAYMEADISLELSGHSCTKTEEKKATCTENGNKEYWTCSDCGYKFKKEKPKYTSDIFSSDADIVTKATGHSYSTGWQSDDDDHWHNCTKCGDQKDTAAHSGGTATCQTQATCSVCGQKYGSVGAHNYSDDWTKGDTQHYHACLTSGCTDKGDAANHTFVQKSDGTNHWQECSVCGYKNDETAHSWGNWTLITKPTLNTTGTAERTCGCGEKQTKADVPALSNNTAWIKEETTKPTINADGEYTYTSTDYGTVKVDVPQLTDSTVWTKGDRTDPTVDAAGSQKYTSDYGDVTITIPQLSNTSVWTKTTTPATEEAEGKDVYTSTDYGTVEVVLPKKEHTHDWGNWLITANPTLTTTGTAERACTKDGTHTETKELPVLTDTTVWTKDGSQHVDPTEEDTGKDVYTSEYGEVEVVLPKKEHTHDWGNWSITANPTLTTTGTAERACTKDGTHTETKELPVLTDTTVWTITEHVDPTEEDTGKDVYTSEYGNVEVVLPKKEHTHVLVKTDAQAADCTTNGNEAYWTCSGCNKMFSDENGTREITAIPTIPSTGHAYSTDWTSDSTSHWHTATCGHDVTSEAAAHTEDGGTVTVPATTENDGVKTYACSVCGYVMRTVTIPKLGEDHNHSFSPDWKHDSTNHWHECDCGEKNEIAPHVEDGGVVTTEPTETSTGIMTYSCGTCGYVMRTDVIPALIPEHNHTFGTDWKYDSVSHWHECECGEKSDIANHISSDWIVVTPATTDLEGVQIRRCTVCGIEIDRETIEKLPNISTGDVAEDVRDTAGTNAGLVQDNTLIENALTPDDKTEVTEGHSFEIVLEVTDIRDSVPAADVAAASSALRYNEQIGIYVDLSLFKIKDNSERTPIYNTSGRIGITLTVPDSIYASDRTYSIIRVHDGIAKNLGGTYNRTNRELTFYTDKFSTYAIAYAASNSGTDRPSVPDTPTNPSVPTYPNTPVVPVTPTVTETTVKKEEEVISDEPYVEDVSSAAGIYESGETDSNIHYIVIFIFVAAAGIAAMAAKKHFCKKNMK